jgi:hypothetical protein
MISSIVGILTKNSFLYLYIDVYYSYWVKVIKARGTAALYFEPEDVLWKVIALLDMGVPQGRGLLRFRSLGGVEAGIRRSDRPAGDRKCRSKRVGTWSRWIDGVQTETRQGNEPKGEPTGPNHSGWCGVRGSSEITVLAARRGQRASEGL